MKRFISVLVTVIASIIMSHTVAESSSVAKRTFDFIVGVDGSWAQAKAAAESFSGDRFYIFFPDGSYDVGRTTGDANQMTTFKKSNVSFIGQSTEGVLLYNKPTSEGISVTATLYFTNACNNIYMQDITLQNKGDYTTQNFADRFVALQDVGDRNIYRRVRLLSNQDTYYSTKAERRTYFEESEIHGTVDFICGGGNVFFNRCLIYLENRNDNVIVAPNGTCTYGYVFSECTIDGYSINSGQYRLGRPWNGNPKAVYLNTTMKLLPKADGWGNPMKANPTVFAEYNSRNAYGAAVDLSQRRRSYTYDGVTVTLNPVLSQSEASRYTLQNVMGGTDHWAPNELTKQISARNLVADGITLKWNDDDNAMCYLIFENGKYLAQTTANSYVPTNPNPSALYTVRAANSMGGLGESSNGVSIDPYSQSVGKTFYFDNGTTSQRIGTEKNNVWVCSDPGYEQYGWSIISRDDKDILYGMDITYLGKTYRTFKSSNGAKAKLMMPDGVVATKVTFVGYSNDSEEQSVLSEINGEAYHAQFDANLSSNFATQPSVISYEFDSRPCREFTFTFSNKQACFIIILETDECDCVATDVLDMVSPNSISSDMYDAQGRKITTPRRGEIVISQGKKYMIRK